MGEVVAEELGRRGFSEETLVQPNLGLVCVDNGLPTDYDYVTAQDSLDRMRVIFESCSVMSKNLRLFIQHLEENEKQKLAIVERGEEKKEAIRQLCFTIDILHTRNQQLQEVVGVLRKRLNMLNGTAVGMTTTSMLFSFGSWSKFFTGEWGTSKVSSHPFAVAL